MKDKLGIVIVTYNRIEKLKKTLECYDIQTRDFNVLIVVNNNSNDGTKEYLEEWGKIDRQYKKIVINLQENMGGSGGFYNGIKKAIEENVDWIWVADDDAYPYNNCVDNFYKFLKGLNDYSSVSAICGSVYSGEDIDLCHRKFIKKSKKTRRIKFINCPKEKYKLKSFEIDLFSYVGSILNSSAIKEIGNTNKDLFIYYDDTEHSIRMKRYGSIVCVPDIKIIHDSGAAEIIENEMFSWRNYYLIRNRVFLLKKFYYFEAIVSSVSIIIKSYIKYYFKLKKNYNRKSHELTITAIKDAWNEKLGRNEVYKPGFKIM